ncbi:MAG TPA: tautomerase family protein [Candidatus Elarobacter sp.]|jgi:phenylpyruvate tautomerase PptA (4-oxalocrotonate tautomerase family)
MPMIDVYCAEGLFPAGSERALGEQMTAALLRAEGVTSPGPTHTNNTGFYLHALPAACVQTAASASARTVRVQVITPPGVLSRDGQRQLVADATRIVAETCGDPSQTARTWVLLSEAADGGWGIAGTAFGREEFAALAAAAAKR